MIKHIVMFRLSGDAYERRRYADEFKAALDELPKQIPFLRDIQTGININPDEKWDVVLTATLDTLEDVAAYAVHPAHVAAASIIAPVRAERACVDYEV